MDVDEKSPDTVHGRRELFQHRGGVRPEALHLPLLQLMISGKEPCDVMYFGHEKHI